MVFCITRNGKKVLTNRCITRNNTNLHRVSRCLQDIALYYWSQFRCQREVNLFNALVIRTANFGVKKLEIFNHRFYRAVQNLFRIFDRASLESFRHILLAMGMTHEYDGQTHCVTKKAVGRIYMLVWRCPT